MKRATIPPMLKIRLQRVGRKHEPVFRLVLTESQNSTKSGRFLEILGSHDPRFPEKTAFQNDRITHWISHGAQTSDTVHNMLVSSGVVKGKKINALPLKTAIKKETPPAPAAPVAAAAEVAASAETPVETPAA